MHRKDWKRRVAWCPPCAQPVRMNHGPRCRLYRGRSRIGRSQAGWAWHVLIGTMIIVTGLALLLGPAIFALSIFGR